MDLRTYLKTLPGDAVRAAFAERCGTTIGHMRNVSYGMRTCSAELAVSIEIESGRTVTRQELCPNWRRIWPELHGSEAPEVRPALTA